MAEKKEMVELGAAWKKTSKAGNVFYSGKLKIDGKTIDFVIFPQKDKKNENAPDIKIYQTEPWEGGQKSAAPQRPSATKSASKPAPKDAFDDDEDQIPF